MIAAQEELIDSRSALSTKRQATNDADAGSLDSFMVRTFQIVKKRAAATRAEIVDFTVYIVAVITNENVLSGI
jgi:hypothetical protein